MSVIIVVQDDATGQLVALAKREEATLFPLGSQQFGPSPQGRLFPAIESIAQANNILTLSSISDAINNSTRLTEQQRADARAIYNTIVPGDRLLFASASQAQQLGVYSPGVLSDGGGAGGQLLIQVFLDP